MYYFQKKITMDINKLIKYEKLHFAPGKEESIREHILDRLFEWSITNYLIRLPWWTRNPNSCRMCRLRFIARIGRASFTRGDMHAGSFTLGAAIGITAKSRLGAASRLLWQITHNSRVNFTHGSPARGRHRCRACWVNLRNERLGPWTEVNTPATMIAPRMIGW